MLTATETTALWSLGTLMLDIIAPAGLWDFFAKCGEPATELRPPDGIVVPPDLTEIVARHGGAVLGPPPWKATR
jgi:hypothetical protein